jgi:putative PEP-CTERM system TPR-repeat lipoprotein
MRNIRSSGVDMEAERQGLMRLFQRRSHGVAVIAAAAALAAVCAMTPAHAKAVEDYVNSAQSYAKKGDLKAAEIELRNAAREAPKDAHIRVMLAEIYLKLGDPASAEREARAARELGAPEEGYLLTLADAILRQGRFADLPLQIPPGARPPALESKVRSALASAALGLHDKAKAETLLRQAVSLDDKAPGPKLALARLVLGVNLGEAEKLVDAVLAADPHLSEALALKGETLAVRGDADGAMQRFGEALAIDPNNVTARLSRANVNLSRGDYAAVDKDLDPVLAAAPQNFGANYLRALEFFKKRDFAAADKILDKISANFSYMVEGFYVQAATKYGLGQYGQADAAIAKYVARAPQNPFGARLAAMIALRRNTPDVAARYLTDYLAKYKPDPATLTLLGNIYVAMKKPAQALEQYEKAAALDPENLSLKTMVAASEIDTGAGRKGLDELEKVFATDAGVTIAGPTLVLTELRAGQVDKAAEAAEKLVERNKDNLLYQNLLGTVRVAQKNYPEAETIFKALVEKNPDFGPARTNLAHVYMLAGHNDEARNTYKDFLARKPDDVPALLGLADIAIAEKRWDEAADYANRARAAGAGDPRPGLKLLGIYTQRQEWPRAKALASELAAQFPSNADIPEAEGSMLTLSGDREGAAAAYRRAYTIAPNSPLIYARYLSSLAAVKAFPEMKTVLNSRLASDPKNLAVKEQLIRVEAEISGLDAALAKARGFARDDPDTSLYDRISADLYERAGKRAEAIALLEKVATARPQDDAVAVALSGLHARAGDLVKAETALTSKLKDRPDDAVIRSALADFYISTHRFDAAIEEEKKVLAQRPQDPVALNNLAWLYQQGGDLAKARQLAEQAAAIAPSSPAIADTLGWVLLAQGDTDKALARLQAASAAMPGNPDIQYHVAVALGRAGRPADARAVLEKLLSSGGSFSSRADAQKLLDELKRG